MNKAKNIFKIFFWIGLIGYIILFYLSMLSVEFIENYVERFDLGIEVCSFIWTISLLCIVVIKAINKYKKK